MFELNEGVPENIEQAGAPPFAGGGFEIRPIDNLDVSEIQPRTEAVQQYRVIDYDEFAAMEFPPPRPILRPIINEQSLNMLFADRGTGKTFFALSIATAVASGGSFLNWSAPTPRKVFYIDGEMPARSVQDRTYKIIKESGNKPKAGYFTLFTPDLQEMDNPEPVPDLSTVRGQLAINRAIPDDTELIIVDNLSALCRTGRENDAESWQPVQTWALQQRRMNRSVLFIHHTGKSGLQRGSHKKEDLLDVVIGLKPLKDTDEGKQSGCTLFYTKGRHLSPEEQKPLEVAMVVTDETVSFDFTFASVSNHARVVELTKEGLLQKDIAMELDISPAAVCKHVKDAIAKGELTR